jgi:two-component system, OmpR family, response regulator TrcR
MAISIEDTKQCCGDHTRWRVSWLITVDTMISKVFEPVGILRIGYEYRDRRLGGSDNRGMTVMSVPPRSQQTRPATLGQLPPIRRGDGTPIRVLLVDDERALTNLVTMALRYEGWGVEVAHDGRAAITKFDSVKPDVVVLDIMLPDLDGLRILQHIRCSAAYTPVLFLTARDTVTDRVTGLTAGADDYMTKPFSLEELVARLHGLLRRIGETTPFDDEKLRVGDLHLDGASREVSRGGEAIELTATEFELLRYLMRNPRRALNRQEILQGVWNYKFGGKTSIVDLYISYLRKKIDAGRDPMICTIRGVGYQLRPTQ